MKKYLIFAVMTVLIAVILIPISAGADNENNSSNAEISAAPVSVAADDDFRGVWISTVYNLDFPVKATTNSQTLKNYIDSLIENCVNLGFNNVILQVSPCSDAIYPSEILPWSKYLTGKQGTAPDNGFDPLQYWVEQCHKNSLKIHAWINPYRITKVSSDFEELSENHPAVKNPSWVVKYSDGNYYYDPSVPQVRELVNSVVTEILQNYDVDGIHLDDYFYPGSDFDDAANYEKYNQGQFSNIADWRRDNVNTLIRQLYSTVHSVKPGVVFGVSPSGIWENSKNDSRGSDTSGRASYSQLYADSLKWVKSGWLDYVIPQIYWEFGAIGSDYKVLCDWWSEAVSGTNVKLYIGLADYKTNDASADSAWYNGAEIKRQLEYNSGASGISGEAHFRIGTITQNTALSQIILEHYKQIDEKVTVYINGEKIVFDQDPVIVSGRTLVPMRKIFEFFGFDVEWDGNLGKVTATKSDQTVCMNVGESYFTLNSTKYETDVPVTIIGDRTMIPLRALSEALKCDVQWDGENRNVIITN